MVCRETLQQATSQPLGQVYLMKHRPVILFPLSPVAEQMEAVMVSYREVLESEGWRGRGIPTTGPAPKSDPPPSWGYIVVFFLFAISAGIGFAVEIAVAVAVAILVLKWLP
jgi:hypothetical protein